MPAYVKIDPVEATLEFGNTGSAGWGFSAWSNRSDDAAPHRELLERVAAADPEITLDLPQARHNEDFVEGHLKWGFREVRIYFETTLSYLSLWSSERQSVDEARALIARASASL